MSSLPRPQCSSARPSEDVVFALVVNRAVGIVNRVRRPTRWICGLDAGGDLPGGGSETGQCPRQRDCSKAATGFAVERYASALILRQLALRICYAHNQRSIPVRQYPAIYSPVIAASRSSQGCNLSEREAK
jgi:hypothetical protein